MTKSDFFLLYNLKSNLAKGILWSDFWGDAKNHCDYHIGRYRFSDEKKIPQGDKLKKPSFHEMQPGQNIFLHVMEGNLSSLGTDLLWIRQWNNCGGGGGGGGKGGVMCV